MARIEYVDYTPHLAEITGDAVAWFKSERLSSPLTVPMIFWDGGKPWREANLWLSQLSLHRRTDIKTIHSKSFSLLTYARWLERTQTSWLEFPEKKYDRCLDRYRGALILMREEGSLSPSTTSSRIRVAVQFYNWLIKKQIIVPISPLWINKSVYIQSSQAGLFGKPIHVTTTSLAIPNRTLTNQLPEEGVWPVSAADRDKILDCAEQNCPREIYLFLLIGFFTGLRVQTISDLKIQTILQGVPHPLQPEVTVITVGPGASPPVKTKYGITGTVEIPSKLVELIQGYTFSTRRLRRTNKARAECKDLLFITRSGNPYVRRDANTSIAINVAMNSFRKFGNSANVPALSNFNFHQTRATFATELAAFALSVNPAGAVDIVRRALLQRNESSALLYIKFVQNAPLAQQAANAFTTRFLGRNNEHS